MQQRNSIAVIVGMRQSDAEKGTGGRERACHTNYRQTVAVKKSSHYLNEIMPNPRNPPSLNRGERSFNQWASSSKDAIKSLDHRRRLVVNTKVLELLCVLLAAGYGALGTLFSLFISTVLWHGAVGGE